MGGPMATADLTSRGAAQRAGPARPVNTVGGAGRRRRLVRGGLAVLLILGSAVAAVAVGATVGGRTPVLAAARDLAAGTVLSEADVRAVSVAADPQAGLIPASHLPRVVGSTVAVPVVAGTLLPAAALGEPRWPPMGKALAAVAVDPGRFPPGLSPGARVAVIIAASPDAAGVSDEVGASEPVRVTGTVVSVSAVGGGAPSTVVSLLLDEPDAAMVAAAPPERIALLQLGGGG